MELVFHVLNTRYLINFMKVVYNTTYMYIITELKD